MEKTERNKTIFYCDHCGKKIGETTFHGEEDMEIPKGVNEIADLFIRLEPEFYDYHAVVYKSKILCDDCYKTLKEHLNREAKNLERWFDEQSEI